MNAVGTVHTSRWCSQSKSEYRRMTTVLVAQGSRPEVSPGP
jgi:hypothetical protein